MSYFEPVSASVVLDEWVDLSTTVARAARRRGSRGFPLTIGATTAVAVLAVLNTGPAGHHFIKLWVDEYARLPWRSAVERMVPSFAAPTARLPYWGAIAQVALVFGIAEALYGTRLTAVVAITAHTIATLSARVFIWLGPHVLFGLVAIASRFPDSGPSGATVGLLAFVAVRKRSLQGTVLLAAFCAGEWIVKDGLAQREHAVAALAGAFMALPVLLGRDGEI
jgi:hypothetical protein